MSPSIIPATQPRHPTITVRSTDLNSARGFGYAAPDWPWSSAPAPMSRAGQNVYQHVFQPARREAADKMNALLEDAVGKAPAENGFATSIATKPAATTLN